MDIVEDALGFAGLKINADSNRGANMIFPSGSSTPLMYRRSVSPALLFTETSSTEKE